jgi:hypothetical protein
MESKISLNNFFNNNDKLIGAYFFFLGFLAFALNIENSALKLDFIVYFFFLSILCWALPLIESMKKINLLKWDLLLFILLTSIGNFTIAKSLVTSFDAVLFISKIIYIISASCLIITFYFGISFYNYKIKIHKKYFFLFILLTLISLIAYGFHRFYYILPFLQEGGTEF